MTRCRVVLVLASLIVAWSLSACSSRSGTANSPPVSGSSQSGTGSAPAASQLSAMVLRASDLPAGWTRTAFQPDPTNAANEAAFAACVGVPGAPGARIAEVHSGDFSAGEAMISSQASSERSPDDVARESSALTGPKAQGCYRNLATSGLKSSVPAGSTLGAVDVTVTPGSNGGPSNVVAMARVTVTLTVSDQQATVYVDVAFIAGRQVEAEIDFENAGAPVDSALQRQLMQAVAARVANS